MAKNLDYLELFAWVGEDELGSGEIGLKQGLVPAGLIPLVATKRGKIAQPYIETQLQQQANQYGKTIYLVRLHIVEVEHKIRPQPVQQQTQPTQNSE